MNAKRHGLIRGRDFADRDVAELATLLIAEDGLEIAVAFGIAEAQVRQSKAIRAAEELVDALSTGTPEEPWGIRDDLARLRVLHRLAALHDYERRAAAALRKQLRRA